MLALLARAALLQGIRRLYSISFRRQGDRQVRTSSRPRRGFVRHGLMLFFGAFLLLQGFLLAGLVCLRLVAASDEDPIRWVSAAEMDALDDAEDGLVRGRDLAVVMPELREDLRRYLAHHEPFGRDGELSPRGAERLDRLLERFERHGDDGLREREEFELLFEGRDLWREGGAVRLRGGVAILLHVVWLAALAMVLGTANRDLAAVEWNFQWLFSFPVPARTLFLARIVEYGIYNPFCFFAVFGLLLAVGLLGGMGWGALGTAIVGTAHASLLLGGVRLLAETILRKRLGPTSLRNIQAGLSLLGLLLLYTVIYLAIREPLPGWFLEASARAERWMFLSPLSLPLGFLEWPAWAAILMVLVGGGGLYLLASASAWLVRGGLLRTAGSHRGVRGLVAPEPGVEPGGRLGTGILGKELRLLLRDRAYLTRTLVFPLLIIGFQLFLNPHLMERATQHPRYGPMLVFGVVAYVLASSTLHVLAVEGRALWLLYTVPHSLAHLMLGKARLWAGIGVLYVVVLGAAVLGRTGVLGAEAVAHLGLAALGVAVYAHIGAALGVLAWDARARSDRHRIPPWAAYLYLFLVTQFSFAFFAPSAWNRVVLLGLLAALAVALWQRAFDRAPYLLDPDAEPAPALTLGDGLSAALAFFVLQGSVQAILSRFDGPTLGERLAWAYLVAAGIVVPCWGLQLARRRIPGLTRQLGLAWPGASRIALAAGDGIFWGVISGGVALLYLQGLELFPRLAHWRDQMLTLSRDEGAGMLIPCMVLAAPLLEEFIFRGLLQRGLARSFGPVVAVVGAAVVFALVHHPLSFVPVLVLGLICGWRRERTGLLWTAIVAHATHNAVAVLGEGLIR